jgi:hypothetical protein
MQPDIDIEGLKQTARLILKERGINPDTETANEVWFRHFTQDPDTIIEEYKQSGEMLTWLYDTADCELLADHPVYGFDAKVRRLARKFVKQFSN